MIEDTVQVFPNNIVTLLQVRTQLLDSDLYVCRRPLRPEDPQQACGFYASIWTPDERSLEIGHAAPQEPTLQRYTVAAQAFVKDMDEERGLARHSVLSKMIRTMLYRDAPLRVALQTLSVTMNDSVESARRWGIGRQQYLSNEINNEFLYLSTLEFWLETETA
jgi:hypothetical protein